MVIDSHVHLGSIPSKDKSWGSWKDYLKIVKKVGIEKYCVVSIGLPENFTDKTTPDNNSVIKECKKDNKIVPIYWFNVFDLPEEIDENYKAIKFHPDIGKVDIDDERVINFVNKIGLPVFVHTNENKEYSNLGKLSSLAKQVQVPVIAIHSGSVTSTFFKLDNYNFSDNVYFETSGIQYSVILQKIYNRFGAKKIILGSDYPFGDIRVSLAMIETLNLNKKEYELITKENILKILK